MCSSISVYEVYKKIKFTFGERKASKAIAYIISNSRLIDVDSKICISAAEVSLKKDLSMADALIFSTAKLSNALLLTRDSHFKGMDNVEFV